LEKVWAMQEKVSDAPMDTGTETLLNQTVEKVTKDIESLKMNTAVSALMIYANHLHALNPPAGGIPKAAYGTLVKLLMPFAPHMASEIAAAAGYPDGAVEKWPTFDSSKTTGATVTIGVQINGKVRATVELKSDATEEEALVAARANETVAKWLSSGEEKRAVYVTGKIINFVVG